LGGGERKLGGGERKLGGGERKLGGGERKLGGGERNSPLQSPSDFGNQSPKNYPIPQ
jgi:hypothetical protein